MKPFAVFEGTTDEDGTKLENDFSTKQAVLQTLWPRL